MGVGTQWDCDASAFDPVAKTITREGITHFSDWAASETNLVNALALTRFTGRAAVPATSLVTLAIPAIAAFAGLLLLWQRRRKRQTEAARIRSREARLPWKGQNG